jgi:nitrite reductase (NADH) small subunit
MKEQKQYRVARVEEVVDKGRLIVTVNQIDIGIFHVNGEFYAWRDVCPHFAAPVCQGEVCGTTLPSMVYEYKYGKEQEVLRCPWHGWEFDLRTGKHLADESIKLRGYKVVEEAGELYLVI